MSSSGLTLDVVIPAIPKDLGTLPYVIDSVRKYVEHPLGRIYVVAPDSERIRAVCRRKGCVFVYEGTVLPLRKSDIVYRSKRWERSGWLYQQLLKLGSSAFVRQRHYLVIDADTVLIRPHRFMIDGRQVFYCRSWSQPEYFVAYRKLLGRKPPRPRSFVTHYMLFDRERLQALKSRIETRHGTKWYKAILAVIDRRQQFGFSEYETYGNYVYASDPGRTLLRSARNRSLSASPASLSDARLGKLAKACRSLSFHKRAVYARGG